MSATESKTVTLNEYANDRENVVLFWAGVGCPTGDYCPLGHPDLDYSDWLDLTGTVDADGDWQWDGHGNPTDHRANTVCKMQAYADAKKWEELLEESGAEW